MMPRHGPAGVLHFPACNESAIGNCTLFCGGHMCFSGRSSSSGLELSDEGEELEISLVCLEIVP